MTRQMKLRGQVRMNMDRTFTFLSTMYDGTPFDLQVSVYDFEQNDDFAPDRYVVDGWLFVVHEAAQGGRCYLTLPKPSIRFGRQVVVNELQLMPRNATLADFRPQTLGGANARQATLLSDGSIVESDGDAAAELAETLAAEVCKPRRQKIGSKS